MRRRQSKEVYRKIDGYIKRQSVINSDKLTEFVLQIADLPEYSEMTLNYCRRVANSRIRQNRDADGLRTFFSNGDKTNPMYINIDKASEAELAYVREALQVQERQRRQLERNIDKLSRKAQTLTGQITLEEYENELDTKTRISNG